MEYTATIEIPRPATAVRAVLVGCGNRARTIYMPLLESLSPWLEVVALCEPAREPHGIPRERYGRQLGVPVYADVAEAVDEHSPEAALVITPPHTHYALCMHLMDAGVHCHVETPFAPTVEQCRRMVDKAADQGLVVTVTENFPRMPIDRFAQAVRDCGYLGEFGRVFSYDSNTNYHDNARWLALAQNSPAWVQAVRHSMECPPLEADGTDGYQSRFFMFPEGLLIADHSASPKLGLGRLPRPGYEEFQGGMGVLRHEPRPGRTFEGRASLRRCTDRSVADEITEVEVLKEDGCWAGCRAETPRGTIEYLNPLRTEARVGWSDADYWYGVAVMDHAVDFAVAVRGLREPEFTAEQAALAVVMDRAADLSAREEGRRVELPLDPNNPADADALAGQRDAFGVDPLDYEAVFEVMTDRIER